MEEITVSYLTDEEIAAPVFIEGLPGIGQVGKLVAEYMIEEMGAELVAKIHSLFFPPQVLVDEEGIARLLNNQIYLYRGERNLLFLVGDHQSATNEGHYLLADTYLDIASRHGASRIYTLGGYGVGHFVDQPRVFAAVNRPVLRQEVQDAGAAFPPADVGMGIVGTSGLLLGLGERRGIEGICLMGETSGYLVDPLSAGALLSVLSRLLHIEIDPTRLSDRAKEMEQFVQGLREETQAEYERRKGSEDLVYIG
ncbi:MAG: proteasome assembly chaperone family protein [Methanomicrobiales archaeon]|nr:proteasome assembly chaperone family protein [Methanomicrobiales archaeon]